MQVSFIRQNSLAKNKNNKMLSRPLSSNPMIRTNNNINGCRPKTAKEKKFFDSNKQNLKINILNSNKNFRSTRPASSTTDRIFNKYWESKTPKPNQLESISKLQVNTPKGEELITNEFLVDINKKHKSIYNRSLYKYNKINWDSKKQNNFLSTVGGLELKPNTYILNNPVMDFDNVSLISTAIGSRPQSNTIFNNTNNNLNLNSDNFNNIINSNGLHKRPFSGMPLKNNKTALRLNSAKSGYNSNNLADANNEKLLKEKSINNANNHHENSKNTNNAHNADMGPNSNIHSKIEIQKRPLTGNINRRVNNRPFSGKSSRLSSAIFFDI